MRCFVFCVIALASCSSFKSGTDGGVDAAVMDASPSDASSVNAGPGKWGALPSGYCCTADTDCRGRNCFDFGGSKMCADECKTQDACDGGLPGLVCVGGSQFQYGHCEPSQMGTKCAPANQFVHGTKKLGQCCTPTYNGANGSECEGGHCGQTNSGDWMCSNPCAKPADCPGNFLCAAVADKYNLCISMDAMPKCTM